MFGHVERIEKERIAMKESVLVVVQWVAEEEMD